LELHLSGSVSIDAPRQTVFERLTDVGFLAKSLPDSEEVRVMDASTIEAKMKLKVSVVSSTHKFRLTVAAREPPAKAALNVEGSGSGSSLKISSSFNLVGDSPTRMDWTADAEVGGIIAGLGSTLLKSFASKKVDEIFAGITKAIEQASG
jgi:carbon monoxide dehydrogenase subunit G